jgi:hypothetical protein
MITNEYISVPEPISAEWLTAVLRQSGVLREGEVTVVEMETTGAFNSDTIRLRLSYKADIATETPAHLVLKRNNAMPCGSFS